MQATKMLRRGGRHHHAASAQQAHGARHVHSVPAPSRGSSVVAHSKAIPGGTTRATQALHPEIERVLFSIQDIEKTLERLGSEIGEAYKGKNVVVLGVLKGGFMLTSDLVRHIFPYPASMEVDFIKASSYGSGTSTSGTVKLDDGFNLATLTGKHVLVVEDIVDSGLTLSRLVEVLLSAQPLSVRVCALLDKRARRKVSFDADYVGFECPDAFVVGYGIDYAEKYRYLPYIGTPKDEFIAKH